MDLQQARARLLAAQAEREARLKRTHAHIRRTEPVSPNFHEQIVETGNDAVVHALEQDAEQELQQIRRALDRLAHGDYTVCSECGGKIATQRLVALPWTDVCVECA